MARVYITKGVDVSQASLDDVVFDSLLQTFPIFQEGPFEIITPINGSGGIETEEILIPHTMGKTGAVIGWVDYADKRNPMPANDFTTNVGLKYTAYADKHNIHIKTESLIIGAPAIKVKAQGYYYLIMNRFPV